MLKIVPQVLTDTKSHKVHAVAQEAVWGARTACRLQMIKTPLKPNTSLLLVLLFDKFCFGQLAASRFSSLSGRLDV
jgi:hypothetical protein